MHLRQKIILNFWKLKKENLHHFAVKYTLEKLPGESTTGRNKNHVIKTI